VFRIRIHLIRIQKFRLNTDPDPIRIQGFDDQNLKKFTSEKRFFGSKIAIYYSLGSIKDVQATEEAFSPPKRTSSSSPFLWVFLPSNPDPKHWFQVFDDSSCYCIFKFQLLVFLSRTDCHYLINRLQTIPTLLLSELPSTLNCCHIMCFS